MKKYKVKVVVNQTEYYEVKANSEQGAMDNYMDGKHLFTKFHGDDTEIIKKNKMELFEICSV